MQLKMWVDFSKKFNSTKRPNDEEARTVDVKLKENCSKMNPVFEIQSTGSFSVGFNYCQFNYIYYYIDDVVSNGKIIELHCHLDVLATHKYHIRDYRGLISRRPNEIATVENAVYIDPLAISGERIVYNNKTTLDLTGNIVYGFSRTYDEGTFVVRVKNGYAIDEVYVMNMDQLTTILQKVSGNDSIWEDNNNIIEVEFFPLYHQTISYYLHSQKQILPDSMLVSYDPDVGIRIGKNNYTWDVGVIYGVRDLTYKKSFNLDNPFIHRYNNSLDYDPRFTECNIIIGGNEYQIEPLYINSDSFLIEFDVDFHSGSCTVTLSSNRLQVADPIKILYIKDKMSIPFVFSQIQINKNLSLLTSGLNVITSAAGLMGSVYSGNIAGAIAGSSSVINSAVDGYVNQVKPTITQHGGTSDVLKALQFTVIIWNQKVKEGFIPYREKGHLCYMQNTSIQDNDSTVGPYQFLNPSIDVNGLSSEREQVNGYLASGFYYE